MRKNKYKTDIGYIYDLAQDILKGIDIHGLMETLKMTPDLIKA